MDSASCRLQSARTLQTAYPIILKSILSTMHASIVGQRTKAIRALGTLITADPDVLLDVSRLCSRLFFFTND